MFRNTSIIHTTSVIIRIDEQSDFVKTLRFLDEEARHDLLSFLRKVTSSVFDPTQTCICLDDHSDVGQNELLLPLFLAQHRSCFITVKANERTRQALFAVKMPDESMTPLYFRNDIVLISRQNADNGDIAFVLADGSWCIRRLEDDFLIPNNATFSPSRLPMKEIFTNRSLGILNPAWIVEPQEGK